MYTVNFRGNILIQQSNSHSFHTLPSAFFFALFLLHRCTQHHSKKNLIHLFVLSLEQERLLFNVSGIFLSAQFSRFCYGLCIVNQAYFFLSSSPLVNIFSDIRHNHYHYYFNNQKHVHHVFANSANNFVYTLAVASAKLICFASEWCESLNLLIFQAQILAE